MHLRNVCRFTCNNSTASSIFIGKSSTYGQASMILIFVWLNYSEFAFANKLLHWNKIQFDIFYYFIWLYSIDFVLFVLVLKSSIEHLSFCKFLNRIPKRLKTTNQSNFNNCPSDNTSHDMAFRRFCGGDIQYLYMTPIISVYCRSSNCAHVVQFQLTNQIWTATKRQKPRQ